MGQLYIGVLLSTLLLVLFSHSVTADTQLDETAVPDNKAVLGWLQSVRLLPHKLRMTAKLDTGAKNSVMHAQSIEPFRQNGREWVRFIVPVSKKNKSVELRFELPVASKSRIKQHHISELDERYMVKLDFCINGQVYTADFSLDNREKFNYPVLLGREFLKQHFIVDPAQTFTKKYHCQ